MTIIHWRQAISKKISKQTQTPQLDAELLLMHVLKKTRAQLYANSNDPLLKSDEKKLDDLVIRRSRGEPMAYLLGNQAFWTMELMVTTDTLIPRPETECLVEWILTHYGHCDSLNIADLGTGSGAIAIALASEKPHWKITATDLSEEALAIAKQNVEKYGLKNISLYSGSWCDALPEKNYDLIASNPPYIAEKDPHLKQLKFEPKNALVSGSDGLDAIRQITQQANLFLRPNGHLIIEHGYDQATLVANLFLEAGYNTIENHRDLSDIPRFVTGKI